MKKYMIAAVLSLAAATPVETYAQFAQTTENTEWNVEPPKMSNPGNERDPFSESRPPAYAPPGEGDGQKIIPVPGGIWILCGVSMVYGAVCRRRKGAR